MKLSLEFGKKNYKR